MFRFWEIPDIVYHQTQSYKDEIAQFEIGYRLTRKIKQMKELELAEQLANGVDVLEEERKAGNLTYVHKCFLMWREGQFTEQNVIDEIDTILIGGIDTSSLTLTNTILMLAIHQDIQERVFTEIMDTFPSITDSNAELSVTQEQIGQLHYLHMVIQESLRILPAGPYLSRTCIEPLAISILIFSVLVFK